MFQRLLAFLKSSAGFYPFNYPKPELEAQLAQYIELQNDHLEKGIFTVQYSFEWGLEREEEALAVLANAELLITSDRRLLLGKWLEHQPDEVLDMIDAYCDFNGYGMEY